MDNETYVVSLIKSVLGVQPYPITSPSDAALPFIIWNFVAGEEEFDLSGPSGFREETYTFTIVARTYDEVVAIREDLRILLQNSSPLTFVNTGESPTYDSSEYPNLYVQNVLYSGLLPTTTIVNPQVLSASYAQTCSFLTGTIESASYSVKAKTAETASYMAGTIESASFAVTAAYALNTPTLPAGLVSSSAQVLEGSNIYSSSVQLPSGLVSASSQIDYTDIQNKPEEVVTASYAVSASYAPTKDGVISSSAQVLVGSNIVSGSTIETASYVKQAQSASYIKSSNVSFTVGWVSSSSQVDYWSIQNKPTSIATASYVLNAVSASYAPQPAGLVSSSAQVFSNSGVYSSSAQLPGGILSSSAQLPDGIVSSSAQLPSGIVSGSTQIADWSVLSSSYALSSSHAVSASWAPQPTVPETSSYSLQALSASWAPAQPAVSASYAATSSTWNGYGVWVGTRAEYNTASGSGLDPKTLYFIKE